MGRVTKIMRDLKRVIKDKASVYKAALLLQPNTLSLRLAVLRATTHSPSKPPDDNHLTTLVCLGDSSRATASTLVDSLMDRLHRTADASVALKCLLTIHYIIKRSHFILQSQLFNIFPSPGGRNHLKLSAFRDGATTTTWALSTWVRWYGRYLETLLSTSWILGFFLSSSSAEKDKQNETISSLTNADLIRGVHCLVALIEEVCQVPDSLLLEGNKLLYEVMGNVGRDYLLAVNQVLIRLSEFDQRLSCMSFGDSVELMRALKRLDDCKERLVVLFAIKRPSTERLWDLIGELRNRVGMVEGYREGGNYLKGSESARFGERVSRSGDSVRFSSTRFGWNKFSLTTIESVESTA